MIPARQSSTAPCSAKLINQLYCPFFFLSRFSFTTPGTGGGRTSFRDGVEEDEDCGVEQSFSDDKKSLGFITNHFVREKSPTQAYFDKL